MNFGANTSVIDGISRLVAYQHSLIGLDPPPSLPPQISDYFTSFLKCLQESNNILILVGAGLSSPSGIPTYRDRGRTWREYESRLLATPGAFTKTPVLSWLYHQDRRSVALRAKPNEGHKAVSELANRRPGVLTINQNIDGLLQRAGHLPSNIVDIHGSLFSLSCTRPSCEYQEENNFTDTVISNPALLSPLNLADPTTSLPNISRDELPHCPRCKTELLRPGIIWFGEPLADASLTRIDSWFEKVPRVDLMLVIGTTACVTPAAEYVDQAREMGARIAIFNTSLDEHLQEQLRQQDWVFLGDAAVMLPGLLRLLPDQG